MIHLAFLDEVENYMFPENEPQKSDIIFVPGNSWPQMAQKAAELFRAGYAPYVLPSGRYPVTTGYFAGPAADREKYTGAYRTEWEFLSDVLIKGGVPASSILREDQATYTYENALNSRKVTDGLGLQIRKAILCTKATHARRCLLYYQLVFPETEFIVQTASPDQVTKDNWLSSQENIHAVMEELERITVQFSLWM